MNRAWPSYIKIHRICCRTIQDALSKYDAFDADGLLEQ
jgi:hypothetical protein